MQVDVGTIHWSLGQEYSSSVSEGVAAAPSGQPQPGNGGSMTPQPALLMATATSCGGPAPQALQAEVMAHLILRFYISVAAAIPEVLALSKWFGCQRLACGAGTA